MRTPLLYIIAVATLGACTQDAPTAPVEMEGLGLPVPRLAYLGREVDRNVAIGASFNRYWLEIANWSDYAPELFMSAPELPPCGLNTGAARTWIDIYTANGVRLYGYCGARDPMPERLIIGFSTAIDVPPPSGVKIRLWDRLTNEMVESNVVSVDPTRAFDPQ